MQYPIYICFNNIGPITKRILHTISVLFVTILLLSISDVSTVKSSFPENANSESFVTQTDTNKFVDRIQFSTWFNLFVRSIFTPVSMDDLYLGSFDSIPMPVAKDIFDSSKENNEISLDPESDDTLSIFYRKYNKRKNKAKGKKKKIWVDLETQNLIKSNLDRENGDSNVFVKPINQSHANDLSFYLNNFLNSNQYKTEIEWSSIQQIQVEPFFKKKISKSKSNLMYGFHPYWMGNTYLNYDFQFFDRICYYGYIIDKNTGLDLSSGEDINAHSWVNTPLHDKAKLYGCQTDLCIASYGLVNNQVIFDSTLQGAKIREVLNAKIKFLMSQKGNGICIDIQKIPSELKGIFIEWVEQLNMTLNNGLTVDSATSEREFQITMVIPRFDVEFPYNMQLEEYETLSKYIDRWILQGESYYDQSKKDVNYLSNPLDYFWNFDKIDVRINSYPKPLVERLVLEIPVYYSQNMINGVDTITNVMQLRNLKRLYPDSMESFKNKLKEKLYYTNAKKLKGVAVWATGYDFTTDIRNIFNDYTDGLNMAVDYVQRRKIETILHNNIGNDQVLVPMTNSDKIKQINTPNSPIMYLSLKSTKTSKALQHIVVLCLLILLAFALLAFVISLFYEGPRESFITRESFINALVMVVLLALILFLRRLHVLTNINFVFAVGILLGSYVAILLFRKRRNKKWEETP